MEAAEDGADYVSVRVTAETLEVAEELLAWWHEIMTTPIVAMLEPMVVADELKAHADFLSPPL
jgi:hypothetical protein